MRSKTAQKILEETPQKTKDKVREEANKRLNMKTKEQYIEEYINYLYGDIEDSDRELYTPDIAQSRADFKSGFNLAEELFKPKWISVEEQLPKYGNYVLVNDIDERTYGQSNYHVCCMDDLEDGEDFKETGSFMWLTENGTQILKVTKWMEIPR